MNDKRMEQLDNFKQHINQGYTFKNDSCILGTGMLDKEAITGAEVKIPLKTLNRHGLIAGATGTGKTKTLQVIAEQLSLKGIPSVLMDLKGDLTGLACPGTNNEHIEKRSSLIGVPYEAMGLPVELMSISKEKGVRLKATVSEFGPVLMAQILDLNATQSGILSLVFRFCDTRHLPLLDLKDLRSILKYSINEGKEEITKEFGAVSSSSVNTILRKIIELEQQGADSFYGERSFEVNDFVRAESGRGIISIIRLTDIQSRPKLFSTFMLSLLSEIYETFPEQGDQKAPKLCLFIDEAHLVFSNASKDLLEKIEAIVKLIRSKGVGIFFCTQTPTDVPDEILGQLGLKIQHSLRAFTAKDRKAINKTAENYPLTTFYDTAEVLTSMGIGEALVTVLNEKGIPSPLVHTLLRAPVSRMGILSHEEIDQQVSKSRLIEKYNELIDRESAFEILEEKLNNDPNDTKQKDPPTKRRSSSSSSEPDSFFEALSKNTMIRQMGRTFFRELTRGIMGSLTKKR